MPRAKPSVFVGSSSERSEAVRQLCVALEKDADALAWWSVPEFQSTGSTLGGLLDATRTYDFGIFVFSPDDTAVSRGQNFFIARDNVLFEFGLFLGALGEKRVFGALEIAPNSPVHMPTDLLGIHINQFSQLTPHNRLASLNNFSTKIAGRIREEGKRTFNLVEKWDFDEITNTFNVELGPARLQRHREKLSGRQLLLAYRKRDTSVPRDDDENTVIGSPRSLSPDEIHVGLVAKAERGLTLSAGDTVDGFLFVVPPYVNVSNCRTMRELKDSECMLLDREFGKKLK